MKSFVLINLIILIFGHSKNVNCQPAVIEDCVCGESNVDNFGRIVNGINVTPNKYPWQAAMFSSYGSFMCGGTVISDKTILTAGHCFFYMPNPLATTWVLGMHILDSTDGVMYGTASYELHPNFANNSFYDDYDFTIVEVDRRIEFNHNIKPICLPTPGQEYSGHRAIVSGWGRLNEGKDARLADSLMETGVTVLTDEQCTEDTANLIEFNTESMICAFALDTDACQGDSGGPLAIENGPNRYELIGAVSFGDGCARAFPGIYSRVTTQVTIDWINSFVMNTDGAVCSDPSSFRKTLKTRIYKPSISSHRIPKPRITKPFIKYRPFLSGK